MTQKIFNFFILIVFLSALSLPLIFSDKTGGDISESENRYLAAFPAFLTEEMKLAPGIKKGLEKWIGDNAGFRSQFKTLQVLVDVKLFHVSPSPKVISRMDGWYFYNMDNNIPIGLGVYQPVENSLISIGKKLEKINHHLVEKGSDLVIVFVPSKVSVYPEFVTGKRYTFTNTLIDTVSDYLFTNTIIKVINTKPDLWKSKQNDLLYFKTDTHWNPRGTYIGYKTIIGSLTDFGLIDTQAVNISYAPSLHSGDLIRIMGGDDLLSQEPYESLQVTSSSAKQITSGDLFDQLGEIVDEYDTIFFLFQNTRIADKTILIFGDSNFMADMPILLAENCSTLVYVYTYQIMDEIVELLKPDIVILEFAERAIELIAFIY